MTFDDDQRVQARDETLTHDGETYRVTGYRVKAPDGRFLRVLPTGELMGFVWLICHDTPPFDIAQLPNDVLAVFPSAEAAITCLIGDPQPAPAEAAA